VLLPLTDSLKKSTKQWEWSDEMNVAFQEVKKLLARATLLAHPVGGAEISVACDVSASHVGAVLQQKYGEHWRPLSFFSRKLKPAEKNYSTFDREMLAAFFRFFLEGREFTVFTDHKPLVAALQRVSPPTSARQQRQLAFLSEFSAKFQHTAGSENVVADMLSRPSLSAISEGLPALDFGEMAQLQSTCQATQELIPMQILPFRFRSWTWVAKSCMVMCPQACFDPWFQLACASTCSRKFMACHIPAYVQLRD
jgi:hypothetical protein